MNRNWLIAIIYCLTPLLIQAQKQSNIWYFGRNAGIDFNTAPPSALTNGVLNSQEGCASIADENGSLLFYTDGVTVWTKNHTVMIGGTGLYGHQSSSQSAIIVPWPGQPNFYYIFTADAAERSFIRGYNYSIVDISRNGGLGQVTVKNQFLYNSASTEKLAVARHSNGNAWWVITKQHNNNVFTSYLVENVNGLNITPVQSSAGAAYGDDNSWGAGSIKVSSDGKKLAMVTRSYDASEVYCDVYDFNNTTGQVSNGITLNGFCQAAEFSSNSMLLYVATLDSRTIDQFDLSSYTNSATLEATRTTIASKTFADMRLGPDSKIYLLDISANDDVLDAINYPNRKGVHCNYQLNALHLGGQRGLFTLPNNISPFTTVVLPVRWGYFKGVIKQREGHFLEWQTLEEKETKDFIIERSADGQNWHSIGSVTAINHPNGSIYSFTDSQPLKGKNYYRLRQNDKDNHYAYSKVIVLETPGYLSEITITGFKSYRGVPTIKITLPNNDEACELTIYDNNSRLVKTGLLKSKSTSIDLPNISSGIYIVTLTNKKGFLFSKKVQL